MSQEKKIEIIKKEIDLTCYICDDYDCIPVKNIKSEIEEETKDSVMKCPTCNGTGIFKDYIWYHIVNGICISGDTLK